MQLKHGNYSFDANGVIVKSRTQPVLNSAGMPIALKRIISVSGDLLVDTDAADVQANLTAKQIALDEALKVPYQDLIFYQDSGQPSATLLQNAGSITGVVITDGPHFQGDKSEYATRRNFSFEAMAEYPFTAAAQALMSFTESLEFTGGGPMYLMARSINGLPQRQMTWRQTEFGCTQSGEAAGYLDYPRLNGWVSVNGVYVPAPKFPTWLKESGKAKKIAPERCGPTSYRNFRVTWSYTFESPIQLVGSPTLWL